MGQLQAKELQVQGIIDRVFDHFTAHNGNDFISFQELYTAILLVYNDINKHFPGPHYDPPAREEVQEMLDLYDTNRNGVLDRKEFMGFVEKFTGNLAMRLSKNILIFSIAAPCLALLTKSATERVPGVGPVVKKIPSALYASLITTAVAVVSKVNDSA
ncbi:hypothetical protein SELMODRAFT_172574 [Selaginella moellendorffii]|uniref:EF-hand domain-containing protein n=1 Tax=Selaginella moellendorffii TaxID=88036 RepID=D8RL71_SELML|nr:uncharacterized protein LOC9640596 [Selaginella moellendorffii]XP_024532552.1 uncharacterized protein LOC9640596 [Selaginella moellendorffii]XP_024532553.1 uncharacterized protein LOC9640596 [Selaginella moellendorffii]EFJ27075.1 hypothetical protein SELMODRAFT_172574 [Selaginella moellendorffii]|eukprot:XP_002972158.1 uncharacterized protein LOC9640596 [Selaginella moellendorffii]